MRIHVVSDVHGNAEALARAGDGADAVFVLGDLLDFVDYHDHTGGILGAIFGPDAVARFAELRRANDPSGAGQFAKALWAQLDDPAQRVREAIREQYATLFAALTAPTYATAGNVDMPQLWSEFTTDNIEVVDGATVEVGGARIGFIGGVVLPAGASLRQGRTWTPYLREHDEYRRAVSALGPVDVLASHGPPALPELTYDVVARRSELGSTALLEHIEQHRPRWSLFGHVHQPLAQRVRHGRTECVNVGHFQRTEAPYVLHL